MRSRDCGICDMWTGPLTFILVTCKPAGWGSSRPAGLRVLYWGLLVACIRNKGKVSSLPETHGAGGNEKTFLLLCFRSRENYFTALSHCSLVAFSASSAAFFFGSVSASIFLASSAS